MADQDIRAPLVARLIRLAATPLRLPPGARDREKEGLTRQPQTSTRIWREEGLKVTQKATKRSRTGSSDTDSKRLEPEHENHVWAIDFQDDQTADGRRLRNLNIVDEHTREVLTG